MAVFLVTICTAGGVIAFTMRPQRIPIFDKACYSDDDGLTWFVDSAYKVVPFDHDGNQSVRALVFTYAGGSKNFVVCLMRHGEKGRKKLADAIIKAEKESKPASSIDLFSDMSLQEVKACGPNHPWVRRTDPKAQTIMTIRSPDGSPVDMLIP